MFLERKDPCCTEIDFLYKTMRLLREREGRGSDQNWGRSSFQPENLISLLRALESSPMWQNCTFCEAKRKAQSSAKQCNALHCSAMQGQMWFCWWEGRSKEQLLKLIPILVVFLPVPIFFSFSFSSKEAE